MDRYQRDGLTFDVTDAGPSDGRLVVLLHGFPQDRHAWDLVTPALNAAGLRTIAIDQRGYSPGATPQGRKAYRMEELTADVIAAIDAAGADRAHIVGHDWGGAVAWELAGRHPARVTTVTVLSTPHIKALTWAFTHSNQWRKSWYMALFQLPALPEKQAHKGLRDLYLRTGMSAAQADHYVERFPTPDSLTGPLNWYRAMLTRGSSKVRPAGMITTPASYLWGTKDFALGRAAAEKTAEFVSGDYTFVELPGAGHWLPEVNPSEVTEAILGRINASTAS